MWVLLVVIIVVISLIVFLSTRNKKYIKFVQDNSITLKKLCELNAKYKFYHIENLDMEHAYDNENSFNEISCQDYLTYQLQFKQREVLSQISQAKSNKQNYEKYKQDLIIIKDLGNYSEDIGKLKTNKLVKIEKDICNSKVVHPATSFDIKVTLFCSKINGDIYRRKNQDFSSSEIEYIINRGLNNKNGQFYNNRDIWDSICRVERGKVSNKMRFSIYKRDGYRCRKCGVSDRYADLEIDHIIPIAKGGKSTYDNLQTLCHRCNVEKGDSLPYNGKKY